MKKNPEPIRVVAVERKTREPLPSERAKLRLSSTCQEAREARARREALQLIAAAETQAPREVNLPASTPSTPTAQQQWARMADDLNTATKPWWSAVREPLALALWSAAWFWLGRQSGG